MALPMTKEELIGTEFQKKVWNEIKKIPRGSTLTYKELAKKIDKPRAYRAVANACGKILIRLEFLVIELSDLMVKSVVIVQKVVLIKKFLF